MILFAMARSAIQNLFSKPATERYPFVKKEYMVGSRGRVAIEIQACIFCGLCQRKCPTSAIIVSKESKTWEIERLRCITCNACVEVCPKKCLKMENLYSPAQVKRSKETFQAQPPVSGPA
jgi:formate hydrogenlyase subunit 6/NADH:ubiquinone oxidoreductase subunit I